MTVARQQLSYLLRSIRHLADAPAGGSLSDGQLRLMLDEELNHLPWKYHAPLVLCYLEGKTHDEAACELRWPVGTVKGHLARGREMLRRRLSRRGLSFWSGLTAALFLEKATGATVSAALFDSTAAAAVGCTPGAADTGVVSASVVALAEGGTRTMFVTKLKLVAAVVLAVGLLGTVAGLATHRVLATWQPPRAPTGEPGATAEAVGLPDRSAKAADAEPEHATLTGHSGAVLALAYSPKAKLLASGSADKTVRLWDVRTRKEVVALRGHTGEVLAVAFSPDGRLVASASADKTVRLWDTATGKVQFALQGHAGEVTSVAFSPDGKFVFTASADKTVKVWDVHSGRVADQKGHWDLESAGTLSRPGSSRKRGNSAPGSPPESPTTTPPWYAWAPSPFSPTDLTKHRGGWRRPTT
jgi:hypothetical protein